MLTKKLHIETEQIESSTACRTIEILDRTTTGARCAASGTRQIVDSGFGFDGTEECDRILQKNKTTDGTGETKFGTDPDFLGYNASSLPVELLEVSNAVFCALTGLKFDHRVAFGLSVPIFEKLTENDFATLFADQTFQVDPTSLIGDISDIDHSVVCCRVSVVSRTSDGWTNTILSKLRIRGRNG